ncbi:MAG: FAD:protein FMN transferase [Halioglobus sp.]
MQNSEIRFHAFGRSCHLVVGDHVDRGKDLLALCRDELTRLENKFSSYRPESITSRINQSAGTGYFVPLDPEALSLFRFVDALWKESKHVFDPTTRILQDCYSGEGTLRASPDQLQGMLKLVGWGNVEISENGAHMSKKGMLIDLNSCVRPYALDCVRRLLSSHDVKYAFIEMDQDAATIGRQPDGANWLVGVRVPKGPRAAIIRLKLNNKGFATRGDFEQTAICNGERFSRALSPVDGQPIPGLLCVAVIADTCLTACSAASVARLKTEATGLKWLEKLGLPWLAVDRQLNCHGPLAH